MTWEGLAQKCPRCGRVVVGAFQSYVSPCGCNSLEARDAREIERRRNERDEFRAWQRARENAEWEAHQRFLRRR